MFLAALIAGRWVSRLTMKQEIHTGPIISTKPPGIVLSGRPPRRQAVNQCRHDNAENGVNDQIDQNIESPGALFSAALFCESKAPSVRGNKKTIRKAIE